VIAFDDNRLIALRKHGTFPDGSGHSLLLSPPPIAATWRWVIHPILESTTMVELLARMRCPECDAVLRAQLLAAAPAPLAEPALRGDFSLLATFCCSECGTPQLPANN
jgi:hypothetical protein